MYRTCRHIKPNGLRCESPALKGTFFCYFHSKLHSLGAEPHDRFGPMRLPTPEGPAAIQLSIAKITDALINGRIDPKRAGQLLYAMQIASQHLESHRPSQVNKQVESMTTTPQGEELAADVFICDEDDDCNECPYTAECKNWHYISEEKDEDDSDGDAEEEEGSIGDSGDDAGDGDSAGEPDAGEGTVLESERSSESPDAAKAGDIRDQDSAGADGDASGNDPAYARALHEAAEELLAARKYLNSVKRAARIET